MSRKSKDSEVKKGWQKAFIKWSLKKAFDHENLYGYHTWPQSGPSTIAGELRVYGQCGEKVMDPATIQGTRVVRNIKLRVVLASNSIYKDIYVMAYRYNDAYGGRPCCDLLPTPTEMWDNPNRALYTIENFQNMLGQTVFHNNDHTEHEINIEGEYLMESGDVICVSCGNIEMFGHVREATPGSWIQVPETVTGGVEIAGLIEYEIAFL